MEWKPIRYRYQDNTVIEPGEFISIGFYSEELLTGIISGKEVKGWCIARCVRNIDECIYACDRTDCSGCHGHMEAKPKFELIPSVNVRSLDRNMKLAFETKPTHYCKIEGE